MKTFTKTTFAAILASSLLAGTAVAQVGGGASGGAGVGAGVGGGAAGAGAGAGAGVGAGASGSSAGGNAGMGADMSGNAGTRANQGSAGQANAQADFGQAIASIRSASGEVDAMTDVSAVQVVDASAAARGESGVALDTAIADNEEAIAELRQSIESNAELRSALEAEGVDLSSVVAVQTAADGTVTVFTL